MKKILTSIWPLLVIFLLWFIFSYPFLIFGKVPFPSTYLVSFFGPWSAYLSSALGAVKNNATPDVISQIYPWKTLVIDSWKHGQVPLWNMYSFGGTPLLANYQSAALSPFNLLYLVLPFIKAWSLQIVLQPLLAGTFTYLFCQSLKLTKTASLISSVGFMFCGFITTWMMYGTLAYAVIFLPLALFAIQNFFETRRWYYFLLITISIPLSLFSGHFQTSIYFLIVTFSFSTFKVLTTKDYKLYFLSLLSFLFGLLISMPQLLPSIEFYFESVRSGTFVKTEVIPWGYLPTLIAPDFFGNPVTRNAWFGHYAEWNGYVGLLTIMLAGFSLAKKNMYVLFFGAVGLVSLLLAFDTPLLNLLVALKIPVLSTSAASRIIVIFSFSAAVLSGFGFDALIQNIKSREFKKVLIWLAIFIGVFALLWITVVLKLFIPFDKISISLSNMKLPSILFAVVLVSVVGSILIKSKKVLFVIGTIFVLVIAVDMLRFVTKWQPFDPVSYVYPNLPVSKTLNSISGYDRQFDGGGQELATIFKIPSLEGYDPLYVGRYGEFIGAAPDGLYHLPGRSVVELSKNGVYTGKLINFLDVKYIIHRVGDGHNIWAFPFWTYPVDQFRTIYEDPQYQVLQNDKAQPRAFFVYNYKVVANSRKILKTIFFQDTDLARTAVLEDNPNFKALRNSAGNVKIGNYTPEKISLTTSSTSSGILVMTDPYYPGWKSYVDGRETKIFRTDYAFRSIIVPSGKHEITFVYSPVSFKNGLLLAFAGIFGVIASIFYINSQKFNDKK